ncbi:succinic semialdehyde dehydrogenase [Nocardia mexicana]|uniref:Succinate-semialdehyde dehydrogenase/glutarate-semialdehyde dehydrogenase n=1 Tax=Nocardia mexicana TaxID=279262 RepID=A0A370H5U9_9NOCA|nr:succinic semialdehyde dehydrogenase [Nocardia mexicana]RDI49416.1 succinate-semialdehyde dehydrogenase/glutarate-semialdehyde dehydrogenase [Nocardia mexicana]
MSTTTASSHDLADLMSLVTGDRTDTVPVVEVFTGEPVAQLPQSAPADVDAAFARARAAQAEWARWPVRRRLAVFERFHRLVLENHRTITDLIQIETGKARRMAFEELCDIPMVTGHYLRRAPKLLRPIRHAGAIPLVSTSTEIRKPRGVVGVLAPWNFPFAIGYCDAIPALLAGNGIVLKPDNRTPLSPAFGLKLLLAAGLPEGLVQIVCGDGPVVGPAVVERADFVMFTGSEPTGRLVARQAAERLVESCLELGGKNPMIVLADADIDAAVRGAVSGVFDNTGQLCLHIERIYVHESVYPAFRDRFTERVSALRVGPGYGFDTEMGALVSADQLDRVAAQVDQARDRGARVLTGGRARPDLGPTFYEPTVLEAVTSEMDVFGEETFGPVVALYPFSTVDEAVERANDTRFGLSASVWGRNLSAARAVGARLAAGHVNVNDSAALAYAGKSAPSGGFKASGLGVRNGDAGLLKFTESTNVATLKRQVLGPQPGLPYEQYLTRTLDTLKLLRRFRIR